MFEFLNILLLAVAAFVAWRLWSVLGTRTGFEKPPIVLRPAPDSPKPEANDKVLDGEVLEPEKKAPVWQGHAEEGSDLAKSLEAIAQRSPGFTVSSFIRGANGAYEMVLEAFAKGDKQALKPLLSREVFDNFASAIDERNAQGRSMKFQFVAVKSAEVKRAQLAGNKAQMEVAFVSDMISATLDKDGKAVEGDDRAIRTVSDVWTFERDVSARDPNWKLIATDADG
jgi:predicted lipid-binding transport protein (Tim44 family)